MLNTAQIKNIAIQAATNSEVVDDNFDALYEYYTSPDREIVMPYGVAKARSGDPFEWIATQLNAVLISA